jgi:hypothetical protein
MPEFRSQGAPDDGASGPKTIMAGCEDSRRMDSGSSVPFDSLDEGKRQLLLCDRPVFSPPNPSKEAGDEVIEKQIA